MLSVLLFLQLSEVVKGKLLPCSSLGCYDNELPFFKIISGEGLVPRSSCIITDFRDIMFLDLILFTS